LVDPATNEELGTVPEMGLEETKEAIEAASRAFVSWSRTTAKVCHPALNCGKLKLKLDVKHRHDVLMKLFNLMKVHHDDLGRLIVCIKNLVHKQNSGKTFRHSKMGKLSPRGR